MKSSEMFEEDIAIKELPFSVEKEKNTMYVFRKPKRHLSKLERAKFEQNKVKTEIFLFDSDDIEKLRQMLDVDIDERSSYNKILGKIREKMIQLAATTLAK